MSIFNKVKVAKPKRSTFDLSHNSKLTLPFGQLVPTYWNIFEPNTTFRANSVIQMRTMPMSAPIMHEVNIYSYWFGIPLRLLMEEQDYENYVTGGREGDIKVQLPEYHVTASEVLQRSAQYLLDYLDYPVSQMSMDYPDKVFKVSALPLRAYAAIYNDYFRDQNTTPEYDFHKFVGVRNWSEMDALDWDNFLTKSRCYTKDYFTSALPWAQRGGNVDVPFEVLSELAMDGNAPTTLFNEGEALTQRSAVQVGQNVGEHNYDIQTSTGAGPLQVDVTKHTSVRNIVKGNINDLRTALSLQRWKERNALGGSRYIEQINAHFGVWADDYRLQRPIFLGGSRSPLQVGEVLQTSESTDSSVQGIPAGRGYTMDSQGFVHYKTKEHMIFMNLISVVPKAAYWQGLPRKWDLRDRFDLVWPLLANLGEQEVRNSEIFYQGEGVPANDEAFGYQSRYAQYKFEPNRIHGEFQTTLLFWHLGRKFAELPTLSRHFLECREGHDGLDRIFPVMGKDDKYSEVHNHLWAQINFNIRVKRPLPYYSTPR